MTTIDKGLCSPGFPFGGSHTSDGTETIRLSLRDAFYYLVNIEEYPTFIPTAYEIAKSRLFANAQETCKLKAHPHRPDVRHLVSGLAKRTFSSKPWIETANDSARFHALHFFTQYMPTGLLDACWLSGGARVALAHTQVGAVLCRLYLHQLRATATESSTNMIKVYRDTCRGIGLELGDVSSRDFANRREFVPEALRLPAFLVAIAQFTRNLYPEILGVNLAWQVTGMSAFGLELSNYLNKAFDLPDIYLGFDHVEYFIRCQELAIDATRQLLECYEDEIEAADVYQRISRGAVATVAILLEWFGAIKSGVSSTPPDPSRQMIDMIWRKAPHACGYHGNRRLGGQRIDDHLNVSKFDGRSLLDALATSPWVKPQQPEKSPFLTRLIGPTGPMFGVFAPREQQIIEKWINSLPSQSGLSNVDPLHPSVENVELIEGRWWPPQAFGERSRKLYGGCSTRELYYYLVNIEKHPDVLPIAEEFAARRLRRSMATLETGERPIPSASYDPAALAYWVEHKHREQLDSYRPPSARPEVQKAAFIEATVQLAPLILIDGGWLQGVLSPALVNTPVGRMLLHVFIEEIGQGNAEEHHANIYRDLLRAMDVTAPAVNTWEFARWSRLQEESFEVPTFWLAISSFPRHFLPEIMGLNLAVELAGVGGPYMEARDTLKSFRYPTRFVDVHNSADNVTAGHSAWAMNAIKCYMSEIAEREGPHNIDPTWHRIWAGVRATLPTVGAMRTIADGFRQLRYGRKLWQVPLVFPA